MNVGLGWCRCSGVERNKGKGVEAQEGRSVAVGVVSFLAGLVLKLPLLGRGCGA